VNARLLRHPYKEGEKISSQQMQQLALNHHTTPPAWNYTTDSNGYVKLFLRKPLALLTRFFESHPRLVIVVIPISSAIISQRSVVQRHPRNPILPRIIFEVFPGVAVTGCGDSRLLESSRRLARVLEFCITPLHSIR
jgi:hypothetical protein